MADTGGFDTPSNRAQISVSAQAGAAAFAVGSNPSAANLNALAAQGLIAVSTFAPEIAPMVGVAVALYYGFQEAMKAVLPQAKGGEGRLSVAGSQWVGLWDIKREWPPLNSNDPKWIPYGGTSHYGEVAELPYTPERLSCANDFERFYQKALIHSYELWANAKLPIISPRATLYASAQAWNSARGAPPSASYSTTSPLQRWGDEPKSMAEYIRLVLSPDFNGADPAPSPGAMTVALGNPPRAISLRSIHGALQSMKAPLPPPTLSRAVLRQTFRAVPPSPPSPPARPLPWWVRLLRTFHLN